MRVGLRALAHGVIAVSNHRRSDAMPVLTDAQWSAIEPLIEAGEMDAKELSAAFVEAYPAFSAATIGTWITDQKNPKYSKTKALVVKKENGKLGFAA